MDKIAQYGIQIFLTLYFLKINHEIWKIPTIKKNDFSPKIISFSKIDSQSKNAPKEK